MIYSKYVILPIALMLLTDMVTNHFHSDTYVEYFNETPMRLFLYIIFVTMSLVILNDRYYLICYFAFLNTIYKQREKCINKRGLL